MHGAKILQFLGAPFERFDLFRVGWGGAHGSRTALALYGAVLVFRSLSPFVRGGAAVSWVRSHAASSCSPLTRKMLLLSRPPSRETCPLPPCEVCVHSVSSHAGQAHSPRVAGYIPPRRPHAFCPARLCRRVCDEAETAGSCRLPQKTWRCDGVSLNCRCSAVLF